MRRLVPLLILAAAGCATPAQQGAPARFANPVLDSDFPDPAVIRAGDGYYYAYATQTERDGKWINFQVARSRDLVAWQHLGDALPAKPGWASRTQDFWAPHVARHAGRYYLYYSAKPDEALTDDKKGLCLAVATADRPEGPFADMGHPLQCGPSFVNIDPMSFDDPATGKRLLYWGSGFEPIKVRELASDRLSFAAGSETRELIRVDNNRPYAALVEGAWMVRRGGWYYLFYSGDNCCGKNAHYAVMVARSRSALGPFETRPGAILEARGAWHAPGHNSVIEDERGQSWIVYHAVDTGRPRTRPEDEINTRRIMLIDRLVWKDGWPVVEGPTTGPQPRPAP
ncbi:MAG TPA: glycoside hydrolase family 43 protein [Allosphingosinicella sp.]|jgi:arabinan endo-1,5-alpha-L-arabinosidase|nr:glycoside hydrolase family 43 protein [Allosphingosinicella sp.]